MAPWTAPHLHPQSVVLVVERLRVRDRRWFRPIHRRSGCIASGGGSGLPCDDDHEAFAGSGPRNKLHPTAGGTGEAGTRTPKPGTKAFVTPTPCPRGLTESNDGLRNVNPRSPDPATAKGTHTYKHTRRIDEQHPYFVRSRQLLRQERREIEPKQICNCPCGCKKQNVAR